MCLFVQPPSGNNDGSCFTNDIVHCGYWWFGRVDGPAADDDTRRRGSEQQNCQNPQNGVPRIRKWRGKKKKKKDNEMKGVTRFSLSYFISGPVYCAVHRSGLPSCLHGVLKSQRDRGPEFCPWNGLPGGIKLAGNLWRRAPNVRQEGATKGGNSWRHLTFDCPRSWWVSFAPSFGVVLRGIA